MNAASTKGLGKGLSALIGESYSQNVSSAPREDAPPPPRDPMVIAVSAMRPGKFQPRTHFPETQLQELATSIRKNGIMQPILVRPVGSGKQQAYEIIAGERRWRAAQIAGLSEVPVLIREIDDQQALELALVENVQRQDLNPLEEALGYQRLVDEFAYTQEELANTVGKSRSHIANLLRLLSLPEEVKLMLQEGGLTMGHARTLIGQANAVELARDIVRRGLNVRQTENLARGGLQPDRKPRAPRIPANLNGGAAANMQKDSDILALEETLSENLGLKVSINDRGHSGEIMIAYQSLGQLDEILRRLGGGL